MLAKHFPHVHVAGNIGVPLCEIVLKEDLLHQENHIVVLEMSNFQLLDVDQFKPELSTIINLTPDHLDYMRSLDEYYASKTHIYRRQDQHDVFLLNIDDPVIEQYTQRYPIPCAIQTYSLEKKADAYLAEGGLYFHETRLLETKDISLVGRHNIQNILFSILTAKHFHLSDQEIHDFIMSFKGVEHRIEYVKEVQGVKYYNDSKATNTDATIIALKAFEQPVILLMGGFEKGLDLKELALYQDHIKYLITFGVAGPRFQQDMHHPHSECVACLKEAIQLAKRLAQKGDIVLLSPSTSSYDEFSGYEERGRVFKNIVNTL